MDFAETPGVAEDVAPAVMTTAAEAASAATISRNVLFMRLLLWGVTWGACAGLYECETTNRSVR
jgi:hypothetical protein